jgi:hypothetical protein
MKEASRIGPEPSELRGIPRASQRRDPSAAAAKFIAVGALPSNPQLPASL